MRTKPLIHWPVWALYLILTFASFDAFARGGEGSGGGDTVAIEFALLGTKMAEVLDHQGNIALANKIRSLIDVAKVSTTQARLFVGTDEKDCLNTPTENKVVCNRARLDVLIDKPNLLMGLVWHEYLSLAGEEWNDYYAKTVEALSDGATAGASPDLRRFLGAYSADRSKYQPGSCFYTTNYNHIDVELEDDDSVVVNRISSGTHWRPGKSVTYMDRGHNKITDSFKMGENTLTMFSQVSNCHFFLGFEYCGKVVSTHSEEIRLLGANLMRYQWVDNLPDERISRTCYYEK